MKVIVNIDIEGLLNKPSVKLEDLKKGKYPFPKEYASDDEVKKLIQKRINELDSEYNKWNEIRKKALTNKYWKITRKNRENVTIYYIKVNELLEKYNNGDGGVFNIDEIYIHQDNLLLGQRKNISIYFSANIGRNVRQFFNEDVNNIITQITRKEYNNALKHYLNIIDMNLI